MITSNNYEDYFLRYTDAELSVEEMDMVQVFIDSHPELGEELDALIATRISSDEIEISKVDFSSLLKNEKIEPVTIGALIELLHEEAEQPNDILAKIENNEVLSKEWNLLLKTKLEDEIVVFTDKQSLYRKESSSRPVLYMLRIAAAAVFVGLMLLGGYKFFTKDSGITTEFVNADVKVKDTVLAQEKMVAGTSENIDLPNKVEEQKETSTVEETINGKEQNGKTERLLVRETKEIENRKQQQNLKFNSPLEKNSPQTNYNQIVKEENKVLQNPIIASVEKKEQLKNDVLKKTEIIDVDLSTVFAENATSIATTASYNDDESTILYMKASKLKDSKLGMAFGKLKRAVKSKIGFSDEEISLKPIEINLRSK